MWHCIDDAVPPKPGTYPIKLFTGAEREAYWTGKVWIRAKKSRRRSASPMIRGDLHLLRFWHDGPAMNG